MLGWMLVFILMSVSAVLAGSATGIGFTPAAATAGVVFGLLLLVLVLARALRGRA